MSSFQGSDLFIINRGGVNYKVTYDDLTTGNGINATDLLMVQRGAVEYKIEYQELGQAAKPIQQNDLFQVERNGVMYAAEATGSLNSVPNLSVSCDSSIADNGSYLKISFTNARAYNDQPAQIRNNASREVIYIAGTGTVIVPKSFVVAGGGNTVRLFGQFDSFNFTSSGGLRAVQISTFDNASYDLLVPNPSASFGSQMFMNCPNLTSIDSYMPVRSLRQFLRLCPNFNSISIGNLKTSGVEDFYECFSGCTIFNQTNIANWDMSSAKTISGMFQDCTSFNKSVNAWGPSLTNVTGASKLFYGATLYDQPMDTWETGSFAAIGGFEQMFQNATNFSQDLSGWCVTKMTYKPYNFDTGSALTTAQLPVWGTCPP